MYQPDTEMTTITHFVPDGSTRAFLLYLATWTFREFRYVRNSSVMRVGARSCGNNPASSHHCYPRTPCPFADTQGAPPIILALGEWSCQKNVFVFGQKRASGLHPKIHFECRWWFRLGLGFCWARIPLATTHPPLPETPRQ